MLIPFFLEQVRTLTWHKRQFYTPGNSSSLTLSLGVWDCYAVWPPSIFRSIKLTSLRKYHALSHSALSFHPLRISQLSSSTNKTEGLSFSLYLVMGQCYSLSSLIFLTIMACSKRLSCFASDPIGNFAADFCAERTVQLVTSKFDLSYL